MVQLLAFFGQCFPLLKLLGKGGVIVFSTVSMYVIQGLIIFICPHFFVTLCKRDFFFTTYRMEQRALSKGALPSSGILWMSVTIPTFH